MSGVHLGITAMTLLAIPFLPAWAADNATPTTAGEIRIAWFGPSDPRHPTAGQMWQAAIMAIDEANARGGYNGRPFRLVPVWSENPWGSGVGDLARLVHDQSICAVTGAPDGPSAHLVAQVVAKAQLPFVSPVSTDRTTNQALVPWVFSCAPSHEACAAAIAEALAASEDHDRPAVVAATDHDSRMFENALHTALSDRRLFPTRRVQFQPGDVDFSRQLGALAEADPTAIVLIAGPADSARFLDALGQRDAETPVYGTPAMGHHLFQTLNPNANRSIHYPQLWDAARGGEQAAAFATRFKQRHDITPDYTAAYTYDAVTLLIAAVGAAGNDREAIRDAIRDRAPWQGVTGSIEWDTLGQNSRQVHVAPRPDTSGDR